MPQEKTPDKGSKLDQVVAEARQDLDRRQKTYRDRALKLFPWVCGKCGREFEGKNLRQLTVHHKDHNHDNNPPDGSNWELLCIYCHDNEHSRYLDAEWQEAPTPGNETPTTSTYQPFADLQALIKDKK